MDLDQILATISRKHPDPDIAVLVGEMLRGNMGVRKQLADMIAMQPALLPPPMLMEVCRWGITDDMSRCAEIRSLA
jgi:hypothetical protein